jgi:hypothetical protein
VATLLVLRLLITSTFPRFSILDLSKPTTRDAVAHLAQLVASERSSGYHHTIMGGVCNSEWSSTIPVPTWVVRKSKVDKFPDASRISLCKAVLKIVLDLYIDGVCTRLEFSPSENRLWSKPSFSDKIRAFRKARIPSENRLLGGPGPSE